MRRKSELKVLFKYFTGIRKDIPVDTLTLRLFNKLKEEEIENIHLECYGHSYGRSLSAHVSVQVRMNDTLYAIRVHRGGRTEVYFPDTTSSGTYYSNPCIVLTKNVNVDKLIYVMKHQIKMNEGNRKTILKYIKNKATENQLTMQCFINGGDYEIS